MTSSANNNRLSLYALLFVCAFLVIAAFFYPKWKIGETEATLSWDVMGYYLYLPSYFYDDISKLHKLPGLVEKYKPVYGFWNAFELPNGNYMMKYSMGMAMMYLPFFGIAHVWATVGGFAIDGFSFPYQAMISFGSIFVSWIGLWFARKNLLRFFDDRIAAIVLLVLVLATNYFNYVSFGGPMTHNYLFTIYCLVIWLTMKWYEHPTILRSVFIGALCGLATVTRPTEIIMLVIPFLWGIDTSNGLTHRIRFLRKHQWKLLLAAVAFAITLLPQLIYWKALSGDWVYYSYQEQGFSWASPHFYEGIFTFRNGWLIYTPVMLLALIGFIWLYKHHKEIFAACLLFSVINLYIVYAWDIWWYGGSFGSRAMIQSYAVLIFPMAAFFEYVIMKKMLRPVIAIGVLFCCWLNLLQTYQCHAKGIFEAENMTRAYYWRIFGKTSIEPSDKKMLDSKEEMPAELIDKLKLIYEVKSTDFDSLRQLNTYADGLLIQLNDSLQTSVPYLIPVDKGKEFWIRATASVFFPDKEWDTWLMTQFSLKLYAEQKEVWNNMMRIQRNTEQGKWQVVTVDIHCRSSHKADTLQLYFWNANSNKVMYIDDLKVEMATVD
ncbi:MAG: hypothetical protein IPG01_03975 [Chitinophagaceae bacterium]|nr:hypothetical protein [Chitinophagaceae bacterium]